jgi:hypothetical protein
MSLGRQGSHPRIALEMQHDLYHLGLELWAKLAGSKKASLLMTRECLDDLFRCISEKKQLRAKLFPVL